MSNEKQNGFFAKSVLGDVSDLFPQMSFLGSPLAWVGSSLLLMNLEQK